MSGISGFCSFKNERLKHCEKILNDMIINLKRRNDEQIGVLVSKNCSLANCFKTKENFLNFKQIFINIDTSSRFI